MKKSGIDIHDPKNIIYLPCDEKNHPTRTVHRGSHPGYSRDIGEDLSRIDRRGRQENWSKARYKLAVEELIVEKRSQLREGNVMLNKNSRRSTSCSI